ncbi:hypothetical protein [Aurantiacibacter suaedae]|uniref:hypothetical protein n=1 Tax=Aurantiacibacter suaedae TaxID=2545755 RepID=UPI0010F76018|nr:hypothetical protein [Aurantiacibacter suaedae]
MMVTKIRQIRGSAACLPLVLLILAIPLLFLFGLAEFSVWALTWIPDVFWVAMVLCIAMVPLAIIPAARAMAGAAYGLASFVFLAGLWLYSLAFTYTEWGMIGVVLGVIVAGIGVVFTAILAALFSASWEVLGNVAILIALGFGTRFLAAWLNVSAQARLVRQQMQEHPSEAIITQPPRDE